MTTWKRGSWRYRVMALFALALLLPGLAGCAGLPGLPPPTFTVPGVAGRVYAEQKTAFDGRRYYGIEMPDGRQRVVYEGSPEYERIERFFRGLANPVGAADRSSIPGGAGSLPTPAVQ